MTRLATDRLLLRPARATDMAGLHAIYSDPEAMRYWDCLPHASLEVTTEFFGNLIATPEARTSYFLIEHEGAVAGTGGFWRDTEIGYILHPRLWGRGLGTELLEALTDFGFQRCGFQRITAEVDPENARSIRMLKRASFIETGRAENTLLVGDRWVGSVYFALDRDRC
jgi:RimJ/RimL family protein N-acetyltransferase